MATVADEYNFIEDVDSTTSVGSTSFEWMVHTFTNDYLHKVRNTTYLSQNSFTARVPGGGYTGKVPIPFGPSTYDTVEREDYGYLEEVWEAYLENLRLVLDEVAVLLENIDA